MPKYAEYSGLKTKITPELIAVSSIIVAAGLTVGSTTSSHLIRSCFRLKRSCVGRVSLMGNNYKSEMMPKPAAHMNKASKLLCIKIKEPSAWPIPMPKEIKVPHSPIAAPFLSGGKISVRSAVAPVGAKPALRPCKHLSTKKKPIQLTNE